MPCQCAALHGLCDCLRVLGSQLKPHASKIEVAAYRCLLDPAREVRKAAAETLASVPLSLKDADVWTAMVAGQAGEALATLHQVRRRHDRWSVVRRRVGGADLCLGVGRLTGVA